MTAAATIYLGSVLVSGTPQPARRLFLPGATTSGHHQIELTCEGCHTPFGGVAESACLSCHGEALAAVDDSHPASKFTDPRNAELVTRLDARSCLTCHREHAPAMTRAMGVTRPDDYCITCHQEVGADRPTHAGLGFDTCAMAGCHNYHDNSALYEDFLVKHAGDPALLPRPTVPPRAGDVTHEQAAVGCRGCHGAERGAAGWIERPAPSVCTDCHAPETAGFRSGKHGMRAAAGLPPMRPRDARQPMRADAADREVSCVSCHPAHDVDTPRAAVDACLGCHSDRHSMAFERSPHARLWTLERTGAAAAGSGVSCATCHLPRVVVREQGQDVIRVEHNQNHNLQPNERMARTTCLQCHGLQFSLDALADRALIDTNFSGRPARHVDSLDMAMRRQRWQSN
jgi:hypothetical protein